MAGNALNPEPPRLAARPHHGRFPIPYVTHVRDDGRPDFRVHDNERRGEVARRRLCQLCGGPLDPRVAFVGFEHSVLRRTFGEPPMHRDCLAFAWEVCPWLAGASWRPEWKLAAEGLTILPRPPAGSPWLGTYVTDDFAVIPDDEGSGSVKWLAAAALEPVRWRNRVLGSAR